MFVRDGAIIPLLSPGVSTLSPYGGAVRLADRAGRLRLLAFPHGRSRGRAYERDRFSSRARRGVWRLGIRGTRVRRYRLEASTAGLRGRRRRAFRPCRVRVGRRTLRRSHWRFDRRRRVVRIGFRLRSGTVVVSDSHCRRRAG
jgi:hypothetical protein